MYTLHIANKLYSSWSLRPWVLMTELGIPFHEELHLFEDGSSWAAYRAFSPTGKVPCLVDGAQVVWDSLGIVEYLAEQHPAVWPLTREARAWARCASAEMHAGFQALRQHCSMHCALRIQLHDLPVPVQKDIERIVELWEQGLKRFGGPYLAGDRFTAVDAFFAPVTVRFEGYGIALSALAAEYAQRIRALSSMRAWVDAALKEPIDLGREQDVLSVGVVQQDLRRPNA